MEKHTKEVLAQQIFAMATDNEDFCKALVSAEDAPSAKKVLNENGFPVSLEDVDEIFADGLSEIMKFKDSGAADELSEGQLDDIAGGGAIRGTLRLAVSAGVAFGFGMFCGICPAAAVASPYVAGGLTAWSTAGYLRKDW